MLPKLALTLNLDADEIRDRRCRIAQRIMSESSAIRDVNFSTINTRDLFELFIHYDELFFDGRLSPVFEAADHDLKFRLSSRMTSTGGMTTYYRSKPGRTARLARTESRQCRRFEIAISSTLLFNTGFEQRNNIKVGGVITHHRLDALQRIFEHELIHLLEMMIWDDSSCARARFKSIVGRFFGHLESNHQLLTPSESARSELGISMGDSVRFHHRGVLVTGIVNSINRRATVLVPSPEGDVFDDERRYQKFYVPLNRLSKVTY